MQRGKTSVQHYNSTAREMLKTPKPGSGTIIGRDEGGNGECGPSRDEPPSHIVEQLRCAYDKLLQEPIPDHLRKLLAELSEMEDKS